MNPKPTRYSKAKLRDAERALQASESARVIAHGVNQHLRRELAIANAEVERLAARVAHLDGRAAFAVELNNAEQHIVTQSATVTRSLYDVDCARRQRDAAQRALNAIPAWLLYVAGWYADIRRSITSTLKGTP